MILIPFAYVAFMALMFLIGQARAGKAVGAVIAGTIFVLAIALMFPAWKWSKRKDREKEARKEPTLKEKLTWDVTSYTWGSAFIQILALGFFFLSAVAFFSHSIIGFIILFVIGVLWECLFIYLLLKIKKIKAQIAEEELHPTLSAEEQYAEPLYKNKGYTYDVACELYCRQHGKDASALTKEEQNVVWDYSFDDFTFLLAWIIEKNFYQPSEEEDLGEEELSQLKKQLAKIKRRTMLPSEFLSGSDGYFMEDEIKEKARPFIKEYYSAAYQDELKAFAKDHLNAELYGFPFRWEDYDAFKIHIDNAYQRATGDGSF